MQVTTFSLECDYDTLSLSVIRNDVVTSLWSGGCQRVGEFVISTGSDIDKVILQFSADDSVALRGFEIAYQQSTLSETTSIPCPGTVACSSNGVCDGGMCLCFAGFVGESCENVALCPSDISLCQTSPCDPLCTMDQDSAIAVSVYGNDFEGTGKRMLTSASGKSPKALKTLKHALDIVQPGQTIVMYPGTFVGSNNCGLSISTDGITVRGILGNGLVRVNCNMAYRGYTVSGIDITFANLTMVGMNVQISPGGGALNIIDGSARLEGVTIISAVSASGGGGVYALRSSIELFDTLMTNCAADKGGALFLDGSSVRLHNSDLTNSIAINGGGIYAQNEVSIIGDATSSIAANNATDSGGGVCLVGLTAIDNIDISQNVAPSGAGLAVLSSRTRISSSIVKLNAAAQSGGGVSLLNDAELVVEGTVFQSNSAVDRGGGVYLSSDGSLMFDSSSRISNCSAGTSVLNCIMTMIRAVTYSNALFRIWWWSLQLPLESRNRWCRCLRLDSH